MKKVVFLLIMISFLFSETVLIANFCNGREGPSNVAKRISYVYPGNQYEVIGEYGNWIFVEVLKSDFEASYIGKKGYVWSQREKDGEIVKEGVCLRSTPEKPKKNPDSNLIAKIRVGSKVKAIKRLRTWVLLKGNGSCEKWKELWIWVGSVRKPPTGK